VELLTIITIALGLSMDALAVSIATGAGCRQLHIGHTIRMALFFGGFQALMPVVGWLATATFREQLEAFDHWVAFAILSAVGVKMIYEAFTMDRAKNPSNPASLAVLLTLSVATSIDALAVGITLSLVTDSVVGAVIIIGLITFVLSWMGCLIGKHIGHLFENKIEIAGGCILIALGVKILIEHVFTGN